MALTTYTPTATAPGSTHTKGSYTQIVAATPYASSRLHLNIHNASPAAFVLLDLATGAAGLESVIVADLPLDVDADIIAGVTVTIDVDIPAGTRLAARCQAGVAASALGFTLLLEDRALGTLATPVTYGTNAAASRGTQIDPGATINTKGSYVQFSASTPTRIDSVLVCCTVVSQSFAMTGYTAWLIDVATGPGGAETVVIGNTRVDAAVTNDITRPALVRLPAAIPAGTRLAVRCECNRNTGTERLLCVTLIGMQEPASGGGGSAAGAVAYVG